MTGLLYPNFLHDTSVYDAVEAMWKEGFMDFASKHQLTYKPYIQNSYSDRIYEVVQRDVVNDRGVAIIEFEDYLNFRFGSPNAESIQGHIYYKLGVRSYSFFELEDSDWKAEVIKTNSSHPRHNAFLFEDYKHFILPFHDSLFECIASSYAISFSNRSMGELISERVENLILTS